MSIATKQMMVGDIYGDKSNALEKMGLASDLVASSFGKLVTKDDPAKDLKEEDIARALLLMITINIGQVSYLNAQLHKTSRIYFVGNFLRQNKISQKRLAFAIHYWSKGEMEALFLEHEGYFGALGAFLLSQDIEHEQSTSLRHQKSAPAPMHKENCVPPYQRSETTGCISDGFQFTING
jgi:pantothenate kinase